MATETRSEFRARRLRERQRRVLLLGLLLVAGLLAYALTLKTQPEPASAADQLREGLNIAAAAQLAVADYVRSNQDYPADNRAAGLAEPGSLAGDYVESVAIDGGFVVIHFRGDAHPRLRNRQLTLIPDVVGDGSLAWGCDAPDLDSRDLPARCARARYRDR